MTPASGAGSPAGARGAPDVARGVELEVDGVRHRGWTGLRLAASIEAAASKVTLEFTDRWDAGGPRERPIRPAQPCRVLLDGEEVLRGHVDGVDADYDARFRRLTATARDLLGDLVDGAAAVAPPFEWGGIALPEFARRLCQPFGIAVQVQADCGTAFRRAAIQPGETAWEALERACRQRGVLPTGDGRGTLLLTRAGAGGEAAGPLTLGENILRARGRFDWTGRHDLVVVRGQGEGGGAGQGEARCKDAEIGRHRPKLVVAEAAGEGVTFQRRADWEVLTAAARSRRLTYTVPGWRGASGALWRPNTLARVDDAFLGIARELLIVSVTFLLSAEDGTVTELEVAPPEAFERLPEAEERGKGGGGGLVPGFYRQEEGARNQGGGAGYRREGGL